MQSEFLAWSSDGSISIRFTLEEVHELFSRVLKSPESDNAVSDSALQKLARALDVSSSNQAAA